MCTIDKMCKMCYNIDIKQTTATTNGRDTIVSRTENPGTIVSRINLLGANLDTMEQQVSILKSDTSAIIMELGLNPSDPHVQHLLKEFHRLTSRQQLVEKRCEDLRQRKAMALAS